MVEVKFPQGKVVKLDFNEFTGEETLVCDKYSIVMDIYQLEDIVTAGEKRVYKDDRSYAELKEAFEELYDTNKELEEKVLELQQIIEEQEEQFKELMEIAETKGVAL